MGLGCGREILGAWPVAPLEQSVQRRKFWDTVGNPRGRGSPIGIEKKGNEKTTQKTCLVRNMKEKRTPEPPDHMSANRNPAKRTARWATESWSNMCASIPPAVNAR